MTRLGLVACLTLTQVALAAEVCEAPRKRDTAPLSAAIAQDKVVAAAFAKAAAQCAEPGAACDQARLECGGVVTSIVQKQVGFDEGVWLRDVLLPYLGQQYMPSRSFGAFQLASDASCNVAVEALTAASEKRTQQATRREGLLAEYQRFTQWEQEQYGKCQARVADDERRSAETRAESERVAAAAAVASEAAKQAAAAKAAQEAEAKRRAEAEKKAKEEAQRQAEAQAKQQKKAQEEAQRQAEAQAKEQKKAQEEAAEESRRQAERAAEEKKKEEARLQREAEQKAKAAADAQIVAQREAQKDVARQKRAELLAQADEEEEAARRAAAERAAALRKKAAGIEVDDSDERARGNISGMAVLGVLNGWAGSSATAGQQPATSFAVGLGIAAHLGFWGVAPADGMASGFELRLAGRFEQTVSGPSANALEGVLTGRYFFGRFGVGAAGALRFYDTFSSKSFDGGLSLALAFVDTPRTRVLLSLNWLPVGTSMDPTRFAGDFEVSYRYFTIHAHGGALTTSINGQETLGWEAGISAGARLGW